MPVWFAVAWVFTLGMHTGGLLQQKIDKSRAAAAPAIVAEAK